MKMIDFIDNLDTNHAKILKAVIENPSSSSLEVSKIAGTAVSSTSKVLRELLDSPGLCTLYRYKNGTSICYVVKKMMCRISEYNFNHKKLKTKPKKGIMAREFRGLKPLLKKSITDQVFHSDCDFILKGYGRGGISHG